MFSSLCPSVATIRFSRRFSSAAEAVILNRRPRKSFVTLEESKNLEEGTCLLHYEDAKKFIHSQNFQSGSEFRRWNRYNRPRFLPAHPDKIYSKLGFKSFSEYGGYTNAVEKRKTGRTALALQNDLKHITSVIEKTSFEYRYLPYHAAATLCFRKKGVTDDLWTALQVKCISHIHWTEKREVFNATDICKNPDVNILVYSRKMDLMYALERSELVIRPPIVLNHNNSLESESTSTAIAFPVHTSKAIYAMVELEKCTSGCASNMEIALEKWWNISRRSSFNHWVEILAGNDRHIHRVVTLHEMHRKLFSNDGLDIRWTAPSVYPHNSILNSSIPILQKLAVRRTENVSAINLRRNLGSRGYERYDIDNPLQFVIVAVNNSERELVGAYIFPKHLMSYCFRNSDEEETSIKGKKSSFAFCPPVNSEEEALGLSGKVPDESKLSTREKLILKCGYVQYYFNFKEMTPSQISEKRDRILQGKV